jgi:ribonuclease BN (tRNA processing enzyme)
MTEQFAFSAWESGQAIELEPFRITPSRMVHPVEAYALRVEHDGRSLVYSGDTGPCDGLVTAARGADVLLCEASWPHVCEQYSEPPPGVHLSGRQAGEHAAAAGVRRLLLTHVPAWFDPQELRTEAQAAFDGPVDVVQSDAAYDI